MDTITYTPIIGKTDVLLVGATSIAIQKAIEIAKTGKTVTLITERTFLYTELGESEHYFFLAKEAETMRESELFPQDIWYAHKNATYWHLYPNQLKLHGESLLASYGITILYQTYILNHTDQYAYLASKHGKTALVCTEVLDFRIKRGKKRMFVVNLMGNGPSEETAIYQLQSPCTLINTYWNRHYKLIIELPESVNPSLFALDCISELKKSDKRCASLTLGRFATIPYALDDVANESPYHDEILDIPTSPLSLRSHTMKGSYTVLHKKQPMIPRYSKLHADVVIVGGGTSGAVAAIECAKKGLHTILLEEQSLLGGTSTIGGVSKYWYGNQFADVHAIDCAIDAIYKACGMEREPGPWGDFDNNHPGIRAAVLAALLKDAGVITFQDHCVWAVEMDGKTRISGVLATDGHSCKLCQAQFILDATGDADLVAFAGGQVTYGAERDGLSFWASLAHYPDSVSYSNNFSLSLLNEQDEDRSMFLKKARTLGTSLYDHGQYLALRESRHIQGETTITLEDIIRCTHYQDAICTCFSNYDPKGLSHADCIHAGFLPPPMDFCIPYSSLIPLHADSQVIEGILVIGKAFGATHDAIPSLRMQRDLMHLGTVGAFACSLAKKEKTQLSTISIEILQEMIRSETGDPLKGCIPLVSTEKELVEALQENTPKEWTHLSFSDRIKVQPLLFKILTSPGSLIVPPLYQRFTVETNATTKLLLAQLLLFHGDDRATPYILKRLKEMVRDSLPRRNGSLQCVQLLPDHGVMAEPVYLLNLLAYSNNEGIIEIFHAVLELIEKMDRDYQDIGQSVFSYIESFAFVAERTGNTQFIEMLERILSLQEFTQKNASLVVSQRLDILRLILVRALARLGSRSGYEQLIDYLGHDELVFKNAACLELQRLCHCNKSYKKSIWLEWLEAHGDVLKIQAIRTKTW